MTQTTKMTNCEPKGLTALKFDVLTIKRDGFSLQIYNLQPEHIVPIRLFCALWRYEHEKALDHWGNRRRDRYPVGWHRRAAREPTAH